MPQLRPERLAEFDRMRRRLTYALLALILLMVVGTLGFMGFGGNLVNAFYMTVITLTTVGFNEVVDLEGQPGARLFTVGLLLFGMGIVAYAVPLLAAFLIEGHFLNAFARRRMQKVIESMSGHTLVCGSTQAARHVVEELTKTGRSVVFVAEEQEAVDRMVEQFGDLVGLVGDPSDDAVLVQAGIERAAGVVACLESDKDNVIVTLTARRLAPKARIIASSALPQNDAKLRVAGANAVVNPSRIGGLRMASELVRPTVVSFLDTMLRERAGQDASLRVEEARVPEGSPCAGRTLQDLDLRGKTGALVLAFLRPGETTNEFNPSPTTKLEPGMTLIVMATAPMREKLERLLA